MIAPHFAVRVCNSSSESLFMNLAVSLLLFPSYIQPFLLGTKCQDKCDCSQVAASGLDERMREMSSNTRLAFRGAVKQAREHADNTRRALETAVESLVEGPGASHRQSHEVEGREERGEEVSDIIRVPSCDGVARLFQMVLEVQKLNVLKFCRLVRTGISTKYFKGHLKNCVPSLGYLFCPHQI